MYNLKPETQARVLEILAKYARMDAVLYAGTNFVDDHISIAFITPAFAIQAMNDFRKYVNATMKFYDKCTVTFSKERQND